MIESPMKIGLYKDYRKNRFHHNTTQSKIAKNYYTHTTTTSKFSKPAHNTAKSANQANRNRNRNASPFQLGHKFRRLHFNRDFFPLSPHTNHIHRRLLFAVHYRHGGFVAIEAVAIFMHDRRPRYACSPKAPGQ